MDLTSAPLADYFWIAGIDAISYGEWPNTLAREKSHNGTAIVSHVESTIAEGNETDHVEPSPSDAPPSAARHSRNNSWNRPSHLSNDPRNSILSFESLDQNGSNRSSVTIRALPASSPSATNGSLSEFDFDTALLKFANERESFLQDLNFSAGTVLQNRPPMTNRAERIRHEETETSGRKTTFGKVGGSITRKISFRDIGSMRRQGTVKASPVARAPSRATSIQAAKRLSNYNSVIPPPEPLNTDPDMHPLRRRFEPVLLDRYPPKHATDEVKRRGRFPDYVPMFAFPNDINIVSADERPRSTWHGFTMTSDDNSKIYGMTVIVWTALNHSTAADLEERCEAWRQSHMSNEERELAASLGERLGLERATLSKLLAKLPTVSSGSAAREALEQQISATEEKITLMADMLRPLRHGAAAKIEGLTDGETGLWTPRAYGILGRDANLTSFWKEWLRAVIVPMTEGGILRVPPSSPKVGRWQPLERYVVNLCTEALSPITSKTQVELAIRELRLFARKEALNELPGSRNTDLYALFRALSIPNIICLLEFALAESRIILLSSHTAMLHLASQALVSLLYPFKWASIFIPVLPARLLSALDVPCPYIVGIERRYDNIELPDEDFVLVDLDQDIIESTDAPKSLPRQQRRKIFSLLQIAAPHHNRYGVPVGPPPHAIETFPYNAYSSENPAVFRQNAGPSTLARLVSENSISFADEDPKNASRTLVFNAFLQSKNDHTRLERPSTAVSSRHSPPSSLSPISATFPMGFPPLPHSSTTSTLRNETGSALTTSLKEKRSGHFDTASSRSWSFATDNAPRFRRPGLPFAGHAASMSTTSLSVDGQSAYASSPSTYAASTLAASTIVPSMLLQPVNDSDSTIWVEGHCLNWQPHDTVSICSICDDKADSDGCYACTGCTVKAHGRCLGQISLVCPSAFKADQVRAAFVRCFSSLLYTYRKYLKTPSKQQKSSGQFYGFDMDGFLKSLPGEQSAYMTILRQTQAFNEFIHERETTRPTNPSIRLFDEIILAKRNRGFSAPSFFTKSPMTFLEDISDHLWVSAAVPSPTGNFKGEYRSVICRVPAKLDPTLMREPRATQGIPRVEKGGARLGRKAVPSTLGKAGPGLGSGHGR